MALVCLGAFSAHKAAQNQYEQVENSIRSLVPTFAVEMKRLGHEKITLETKPDDPTYLQMIEAQKDWSRLNPELGSIYSMRLGSKGEVMTIVGEEFDYNRDGRLDPQTEMRSPIGRVYDGLQAEVKEGLAGKIVITEPYTDDFGSWVTVVAPIFNSEGKPEAILGLDYPVSLYEAGAQKIRLIILGMGLAILGLVYFVVWFISSLKSKTQDAANDISRMAKNLREGQLNENLDKSQAALGLADSSADSSKKGNSNMGELKLAMDNIKGL